MKFLKRFISKVAMANPGKDDDRKRLMELWRLVSTQIDSPLGAIQLDIKTVDGLGPRGESHFVYRCRYATSPYMLYVIPTR